MTTVCQILHVSDELEEPFGFDRDNLKLSRFCEIIRFQCGLYSHGLYSYGLQRYGAYTYGAYSYGHVAQLLLRDHLLPLRARSMLPPLKLKCHE